MNYKSGKIRSFTDLNSWKEGHILVIDIYRATKDFPKEELFGLVSQMRRCSVSITSNIAEGFSRKSFSEKIRFYYISQGSNTELQNQLIISKDIGYINKDKFNKLFQQTIVVQKLINGLIKGTRKFLKEA